MIAAFYLESEFEMEDKIIGKMTLYNQFTKELDGLYHLYARRSGLADTAFWILYSIEESQSVYTQKELCEAWSYSRQTVNSALKKLEAQEIIELVPLPDNRKNKQIVLTESGKALVEQVIAPLIEAEKNVFVKLGDQDADEFLRLTQRHLELFHEEIKQVLR